MRKPPQELKRAWNDRYPENGMAVIFCSTRTLLLPD